MDSTIEVNDTHYTVECRDISFTFDLIMTEHQVSILLDFINAN
jgi:hypothetical protein